jgi:hypothetical protein
MVGLTDDEKEKIINSFVNFVLLLLEYTLKLIYELTKKINEQKIKNPELKNVLMKYKYRNNL